jgi:amino acid efflux transporter
MNAYVAAATKLAGALAEQGAAPAALARPGRALALFAAAAALLLAPLAADLLSLQGLVRATSASFVSVYVVATAAGIRLLDGAARRCAATGFVAVVAVLAFSGAYLLVPLAVGLVVAHRRRHSQRPKTRRRTATAVSALSANTPSAPSR